MADFTFPLMISGTWLIATLASFILGISKSGIKGISIVIVTLLALAFGARASTGILLPLLVVGDAFAVIYYNRHTQWKYIVRILPWMVIGVILGTLIGNELPQNAFKLVMAGIILFTVGMMYWWDRKKSKNVPTHWAFAGFIGTLAGITTMIGNLAGAFSNIYFLAMRLPKNEFIGTAAWLFFIVNIFKIPFHYFVWGTIDADSLMISARLLPGIIIGLFCGVKLVEMIKDNFYRKMILVLTAVGALLLFFR
ncbi:sulfite exporter TauE/SafE family protein [Membranihabitans maritimus]|uniref:sulfite exporter TauE/SafE family protein n=1 Tax=Membranihabitans maritimus TaxID=2904244 RepID=UPI001F1CC188|nr:sulfite exporter TauE/SafE family protein [Membranihabitans maritimus]